MNEDNVCLICFEDSVDTILTCCNKYIHGSCVKQWWELNNINIDDAICPHCQQKASIKKIVKGETQVSNKYLYSNARINQILPASSITHNIQYNLTDSEIELINSNNNNVVPDEMFSHQSNPDEETDIINWCSQFCINLIAMLFLIAIVLSCLYFIFF